MGWVTWVGGDSSMEEKKRQACPPSRDPNERLALGRI